MDQGAELQHLEPDCATGGFGELGVGQADAAQGTAQQVHCLGIGEPLCVAIRISELSPIPIPMDLIPLRIAG